MADEGMDITGTTQDGGSQFSGEKESATDDPEGIMAGDLSLPLPRMATNIENHCNQVAEDPGDILNDSETIMQANERGEQQERSIVEDGPANSPESISLVALCEHPACAPSKWETEAKFFRQLDLHERVRAVRSIFLATVAPKGCFNSLGRTLGETLERQRKRRRENCTQAERSSIFYALRGNILCRAAFAQIVGLDSQTVQRHATRVSSDISLVLAPSRKDTSRLGHIGIQRRIVHAFLREYSNNYALECPRGRGSQDEKPLLLLPSVTTKVDVHDEYTKEWSKPANAAAELAGAQSNARTPLSYSVFIRVWNTDFPTLRIAKSGTDFFNFCTSMRRDIECLPAGDERIEIYTNLLQEHRENAAREFMCYRDTQRKCAIDPYGNIKHLVFDFAEKVLLPRIVGQPGQLHFITGLKFDFFAIASSNESVNYIYGLPEGHWPGEKTANTVVSMLHHTLEEQRRLKRPGYSARDLILHAHNCAGQNKNRFVCGICLGECS